MVLQVKTMENDGYGGSIRFPKTYVEVLSNKPAKGHVAKANATLSASFAKVPKLSLENIK